MIGLELRSAIFIGPIFINDVINYGFDNRFSNSMKIVNHFPFPIYSSFWFLSTSFTLIHLSIAPPHSVDCLLHCPIKPIQGFLFILPFPLSFLFLCFLFFFHWKTINIQTNKELTVQEQKEIKKGIITSKIKRQ